VARAAAAGASADPATTAAPRVRSDRRSSFRGSVFAGEEAS